MTWAEQYIITHKEDIKARRAARRAAYHKAHYIAHKHGPYKKHITKTCIKCGKEFTVTPCYSHRKYCSSFCGRFHPESNNSILTIHTCKNCGNDFKINCRSEYKSVIFCSRECRHNYNGVEIKCLHCGKINYRYKSVASGNRNGPSMVFCNKKCYAEYNLIKQQDQNYKEAKLMARKIRYITHREEVGLRKKKYNANNAKKVKQWARTYHIKNRTKARETAELWRRWGTAKITKEEKKKEAVIRVGKMFLLGRIKREEIIPLIERINKGETSAAYN
jgi:hypothetical protein